MPLHSLGHCTLGDLTRGYGDIDAVKHVIIPKGATIADGTEI